MDSKSEALIDDCIDKLYMSLTDPASLPGVVDSLRQCFDATAATYFSSTHGGRILNFAHCGHDADIQQRYVSYYAEIDPNRSSFLGARPGQWMADDSLLDSRTTPGPEYVNDFARHAGLRYIRGGKVFEDEQRISFFSVQRPQDARPFGPEALSLLELIYPHLKRYSRIIGELGDTFPSLAMEAAATDILGVAVCIVDSTGKVHFQNRAAEALLTTSDDVCIRGGRLFSCDPDVSSRLFQAILLATQLPRKGSAFCAGPKSCGITRLQVRVLPLADHHPLSRFGHNRFALLFLAAGPGSRHPNEMRNLFGATQSETELIELLSRGLTPAECAERRQVSINTIRTQLASLLAKTGTRSQAQLVALVMSLPALRL